MSMPKFFMRDAAESQKAAPAAEPAAPAKPAVVEVRDPDNGAVDLIDALLHGKEIVTVIETGYGPFEFKYPSGADKLRIAHRRAAYLGGHPDSSFDNARRMLFEIWATLDILITKKPERFSALSSWADCPDPALVDMLYDRGSRFCGEIRAKVDESRPGQSASGGQAENP